MSGARRAGGDDLAHEEGVTAGARRERGQFVVGQDVAARGLEREP